MESFFYHLDNFSVSKKFLMKNKNSVDEMSRQCYTYRKVKPQNAFVVSEIIFHPDMKE